MRTRLGERLLMVGAGSRLRGEASGVRESSATFIWGSFSFSLLLAAKVLGTLIKKEEKKGKLPTQKLSRLLSYYVVATPDLSSSCVASQCKIHSSETLIGNRYTIIHPLVLQNSSFHSQVELPLPRCHSYMIDWPSHIVHTISHGNAY